MPHVPQAQQTHSENPLTSLSGAHIRLSVPKSMTVKLTDTSRLALGDVGTLFFTIFLSLAVGFGTSYFAHKDAPTSLKFEFIGWIVATALTLAVILKLRWDMYRAPSEVISYRADIVQEPPSGMSDVPDASNPFLADALKDT